MLSLLPGLTPRHQAPLLSYWDSPRSLLEQSPETLRALGLPPATRSAIAAWQAKRLPRELQQWLDHAREGLSRGLFSLLTWDDATYPPLLRHIADPPALLYVRGNPGALQGPQLAIVGSRRASRDGLDNAGRFARELSQAGYGIVSGLALGADGAAHQGALEAQGRTVAVLAAGVERIYPPRHRALAEALLAQQGVLISELPPTIPSEPQQFPRRNRIISGLSRGVLVVEASLRSGSLVTARLAMEQGREVFALPGSLGNAQARGCHQLIRDGARLVESVPQILEELTGWQQQSAPDLWPEPVAGAREDMDSQDTEPETPVQQSSSGESFLSAREQALLAVMGFDPQSTDTLCERSGLPPEELMQCLMGLEMAGVAYAVAGGYRRSSG
ncbi:MAG: DNA-protecting protein DprA [Halomonadaceae bacterium]|nr:MAG: DNA-protecting protein DprA [Halomonadaceae bacterium]